TKIYLRCVTGITSYGCAPPVEDVAKELFPKNFRKILVGIN
ncbi:6124_t:CDS:1, partial [Entrophospora sp. SA101]